MSYVKMLKEKLGSKQFKFINRGVAGYESYNVLKHLDKAVKSIPDFVVLLVGTNDVTSSLDPRLARLSRKLKHIPHEPTLFHYSRNMTSIVQFLKKETDSKIAVASLPVLGENLDSVENRTIATYNDGLKKICEKENVTYLPVYEKQKNFLMHENDGKGKDYVHQTKTAYQSLFLHYMLFMSLDAISRKNGYLIQIDGIHQNSVGAKIIADEIENFILNNKH